LGKGGWSTPWSGDMSGDMSPASPDVSEGHLPPGVSQQQGVTKL
jgi:hypothetical protein